MRRTRRARRVKTRALTGRVKSGALTPPGGYRRRRARGIIRLRQVVKALQEAGALWWPPEEGWPTQPLRDIDVRMILASLMREADRRWHSDGYDWYPQSRLVDVLYDVILGAPVPRRLLEAAAAVGIAHIARLNGVVRGDDV